MTRELVTLDVGNSSLKLRRWSLAPGAALRLEERVEFAPEALGPLEAWLRARRTARAALSCVAAPALEQRVRALFAAGGALLAPESLDTGLENATSTPETVGRDRLFAARGAFELTGRSSLVIDAGTALTVDALAVTPGAARPRFLGGAIAPGPRLLSEALHAGTARLPKVEAEPGVPALGRETHAAIRAGLVHGFRGAARELVARIAEEGGLVGAPCVFTGGAAALLLEPALFESGRARFEPELVHLGLLCALLDSDAPGWSVTPRHGLRA